MMSLNGSGENPMGDELEVVIACQIFDYRRPLPCDPRSLEKGVV